MKILVVTSEVTFVPENYNLFLESFLRSLPDLREIDIKIVVLKNNSLMLSLRGLLLIMMGSKRIGFHLIKNSIKAIFKDKKYLAKKHNISIHYFKNPNNLDFIEFAKNNNTDLMINARTRFIYKSKILKIPKLASINIHHGLLPNYRGTMCDLWALMDNRPTGFTVHVMDKKIDNGAIIKRVQTSVLGDSLRLNFASLIKESSKIEGQEMAKIILAIRNSNNLPIESDNISIKPIYSKNPDFFTIRKILQKGIKL